MGENYYNKYLNEYQSPHYQVKASVVGSNGASQQFAYDVNSYPNSGFESNTHLSSLSNIVKRLQTRLNNDLTKIIDEGSDGPTNYQLGSGEVLNSHLMEQYSSPNSASGIQSESPATAAAAASNNGYSYYSNYPQNYPPHHHLQHQQHYQAAHSAQGQHYPASDYYGQQYSNFQEPKPKKHKNK